MNEASRRQAFALAQEALYAGRLSEARSIAEQMLASKRNDSTALVILSRVALDGGRSDEAAHLLEQAVRAHPDRPRLRVQLGQVYFARGDLTRALAQYDRALKQDPAFDLALASKAEAYERQNRYDRMRRVLADALNQTIAVTPPLAGPAMRLLMHDGDHAGAANLGQSLRERNPPADLAYRGAMFQLAAAYEKLERYGDAIDAATLANSMLQPEHDPEAVRDQIDQHLASFTVERFRTLARSGFSGEELLFIVGMPRCGSTLTERILDAHPDAHGIGESSAMHRLVMQLKKQVGPDQPYPKSLASQSQSDLQPLASAYLAEARKRAPRVSRIVDKNLGNFLHLGVIAMLFPEARIVHCRRNALDTCLSCFMNPLTPAGAPFATDMNHLGRYYREYDRLMNHWRNALPLRILELNYESLLADQASVTRDLLAFCGLPFDEACLRFNETKRIERTLSYDQVRKPLYHSSIRRAARFGSHLNPLRLALGLEPVESA